MKPWQKKITNTFSSPNKFTCFSSIFRCLPSDQVASTLPLLDASCPEKVPFCPRFPLGRTFVWVVCFCCLHGDLSPATCAYQPNKEGKRKSYFQIMRIPEIFWHNSEPKIHNTGEKMMKKDLIKNLWPCAERLQKHKIRSWHIMGMIINRICEKLNTKRWLKSNFFFFFN